MAGIGCRGSFVVALVFALAWGTAQAEDMADADAILAAAGATCEGFEDGRFDPGSAVVKVDLDGDGAADTLVDESRFACSSAASLYCGSGGCMLHALVGGNAWRFQAEGWRVIDWDGQPILLIARDGGWCGGAGAQVCYEAVTWSAGAALSVMPPR